MPPIAVSFEQALLAESAELRARLEKAEATLRVIASDKAEDSACLRAVSRQGLAVGSNHFLSEILAQVSDVVIAIDGRHRITYLNAAAERQYGAAALGSFLCDLFEYRWLRPEDEAAARKSIGETGHWRGENIHIKRNGEAVHVESSVSRLRAENGTNAGLFAVIRDITESRRTEAALQASEERLRLIANLVPHGVFAKDTGGRYFFGNRALAESLGLPIEEVLGKTDFDLVADKAQAEAYRIADREVIESGNQMFIPEELHTDWSGATRFLQTTKIPFTVPETGERAVLGAWVDITECKRAEAARRVSEAGERARRAELV